MKRLKPVWYVGWRNGTPEVFRWTERREPTQDDHDGAYIATWGPFKTLKGATFGASWRARGNPHAQSAAQCDAIASDMTLQEITTQ